MLQKCTEINLLRCFLVLIFYNCLARSNGAFTAERRHELEAIVDLDGGYMDLLKHSEFLHIHQSGLAPKTIAIYEAKVLALAQKMQYFLRYEETKPLVDNLLLANIGDSRLTVFAQNEENVKAVNSKLFMKKLQSEEGSFLELGSFMQNAEGQLGDNLKRIDANANIQSAELDELAMLVMVNAHMQNRQSAIENNSREGGAAPIKGVLIEGGGPSGLYAAFAFFMAGMEVTLVNDRLAYTRTRRITLYSQWMASLKFLVGHKLDSLLWHTPAVRATLDAEHKESKCADLKVLEQVMKERLEMLARFIDKHQLLSKRTLVLLYETKVEKIVYDESGHNFVAKLAFPAEQSMGSAELLRHKSEDILEELLTTTTSGHQNGGREKEIAKKMANDWIIGEKRKNIEKLMELKYGANGNNFIEVGGNGGMISAEILAIREMEEEKEWSKYRQYPDMDFDLLLCAGGVNDAIRAKYLGAKTRFTLPYEYGLVTFVKSQAHQHSNKYLFGLDWNLGKVDMDKGLLANQQIDQTIRSSPILPEEIKEKYANISGHLEMSPFTFVHENGKFLQFTLVMPEQLAQLKGELEKLKKEIATVNIEALDRLRRIVERKWFRAVLDSALAWKHRQQLNHAGAFQLNGMKPNEPPGSKYDPIQISSSFDPYPINMLTFRFSAVTAVEPAKLLRPSDYAMLAKGRKLLGKNMPPSPPISRMKRATAAGAARGGGDEMGNNSNIVDGKRQQPTAIMAAIGDANANTHFATGLSLSVGRTGIEKLADLVQGYNKNSGKVGDNAMRKLADLLGTKLKSVQELAIKLTGLAKKKIFIK